MAKRINGTKPATKKDLQSVERKIGKRMDGFDKRMDGFDKRMDGFDKRMDGFDKRMKDFRNELSAHKIAIELKLEDHQEATKQLIIGFKNEILNAVDGVMKELETMRQENVISADMRRQLNEHEDRLETVEGKLGINVAL